MSAHPETTPALGPSDAPTKPYTLPAWLKRWVSRTKVQAIKSTPTVASANASGTARPMEPAVPCGFMFAAIEGAIRASEMPTASHRCSSRRRCGLPAPPALLASVVIPTPFLVGWLRMIWSGLVPDEPGRDLRPSSGSGVEDRTCPGRVLPRGGGYAICQHEAVRAPGGRAGRARRGAPAA